MSIDLEDGRYTVRGTRSNPQLDILCRALGRLSGERAFLVYRLQPSQHGGRPDKVPCDPETGEATAPNAPRDRATMTLREAWEAAERLGSGWGAGLFPAAVPGLVAVDLDSCVSANGEVQVDDWARAIVGEGEAYAELSPSLTGLRLLVLDPQGRLEGLASGAERCGVGLYGRADCKKFVTLTGLLAEQGSELVGEAPGVVSRVLAHLASMMGEERARSGGGLDYPPGQAGLDEAVADILSGASLHPATLRVAAAWHNDLGMSTQDVREGLLDLYDRSRAREATPRRWRARRERSVTGVMEWLERRQGGRKLADVPTQAVQAARALVERLRAEGRGIGGRAGAQQSPAPEHGGGEAPGRKLWEGGRAEGAAALAGGQAEARIEARAERWGEVQLEAIDELEREEALASGEGQEWMLAPPCPGLELLVRHAWRVVKRPAPSMAILSALAAASAACRHGFLLEGVYLTALNLQATIVANTGFGKEALATMLSDVGRAVRTPVEGRPSSGQGLHQALVDARDEGGLASLVLVMDEVSGFLRATADREGMHARGLKLALMATVAAPLGTVQASSYAQSRGRREAVECPYVTSVGFTTPWEWDRCLTDGFFMDGWVNRQLVAVVRRADAQPEGHVFRYELDDDVLELVEEVRRGAYVGVLRPDELEREGVVEARGRRFRRVRIDRELDLLIGAAEEAAQERYRQDDPRRAALSRHGELVRKVAGIMAVLDTAALGLPWGRARASEAHVRWAIRLVDALTQQFLGDHEEHRREGALADPEQRLRAALREWVLDPTSHPKNGTHHLSRWFEIGEYPEWVLRKVVGSRPGHEFDSIARNAGLVRVGRSRASSGEGRKGGATWTWEGME